MMHIRIFDLIKKNCETISADDWIKKDFEQFARSTNSKIVFDYYKQSYSIQKSIEKFNNIEQTRKAQIAPLIVGMPA